MKISKILLYIFLIIVFFSVATIFIFNNSTYQEIFNNSFTYQPCAGEDHPPCEGHWEIVSGECFWNCEGVIDVLQKV